MAIILLVARPYSAAIALVEKISLPMILMNSFGMMVFIGVFNRIFLVEESLYGEKMRIALAIAEKSLPHLRNGLHSRGYGRGGEDNPPLHRLRGGHDN